MIPERPSPKPADHAPIPYQWRNVVIGGGGYVTAVVIHPTEPGRIFIRTDVGGIYRLDPDSETWRQTMAAVPYPDRNLLGVDGIALAPSDPALVVAACGQHLGLEPSDILLSHDAGQTWRRTGLGARFGGNMPRRMDGECVAVHPRDARWMVAGTREQGLWSTRDGGLSWQPADLPAGLPPAGIRQVLFGEGGDSLYAAVDGHGAYRSRDEARTWTPLEGGPPSISRMALLPDGSLVATARGAGGVFRHRQGRWEDITPLKGREFGALAISPHRPGEILVSPSSDPRDTCFRLPLFLSRNGGEDWSVLPNEPDWRTAAPWMPSTHFCAATSCLAYDPHHPGRVYLADWYAVWMTEDVGALPVRWRALMKGHEETFVFDLAAPPQGAELLSAMADNVGYYHESTAIAPHRRLAGRKEVHSLDFCESNPARVVALSGTRYGNVGLGLYLSDDFGRTQRELALPLSPGTGHVARVACSATDPGNLVMVASGQPPWYTRDAGATWAPSRGAPAGSLRGHSVWNYHHPLASDRVEDSVFYLYCQGHCYRSTDGGAHFTARGGPLPVAQGDFVNVAAAPGVGGLVLLSLAEGGLWLSRDGAETFRPAARIGHSLLAAWGLPGSPGEAPRLFCYGCREGWWSLFRSDDLGANWSRIAPAENPLGAFPSRLAGDRRHPGVVYLGTTGSGIFRGEPQA